MAKKKRRKVKKEIKRSLEICFLVSQVIAILCVSIIFFNSLKPTEILAFDSLKETIDVQAKLQNNSLSNSKKLKEYIVQAYSATNKTDISADSAKVVMTSPVPVVHPNLYNSSFVVIPLQEKETIEATAVKISDEAEVDEYNKDYVKALLEGFEKNSSNNQGTSEGNINIGSNQESDEINSNSQEAIAGNVIDLDTTPYVPDTVSSGVRSTVTTEYTVANDMGLSLTLAGRNIEILDGSEYNPMDYLIAANSELDEYPAIKVTSNVDSTTDGNYNTTYTVIDSHGNSLSETVNVGVLLPEHNPVIIKQRLEATKKAVKEYADKLVGKSYDVDGAYGDQCWDLWAKYCQDLNLDFDYHTKPYGYAYGVSLKYSTSGASKYFKAVSPSEVQPGDWCFWNLGSSYPDSHVALLLELNDDGTGTFLSQTRYQGTTIERLNMDLMEVNMRPVGDIAWYN